MDAQRTSTLAQAFMRSVRLYCVAGLAMAALSLLVKPLLAAPQESAVVNPRPRARGRAKPCLGALARSGTGLTVPAEWPRAFKKFRSRWGIEAMTNVITHGMSGGMLTYGGQLTAAEI